MYNEKCKINTMKYMKERRDKLTLDMPKGAKERYRQHAQSQGKYLNALIIELLERDIAEKSG